MSDVGNNIDSIYAVATGRKTFFQATLDDYDKEKTESMRERLHAHAKPYEAPADKANLISSEIRPDAHMPVIDCDFGIQAIASSTPGHYHLYIDHELTWPQYEALLDGFYRAGLIQEGWYQNALKDRRSYVRLPHIRKPEPDPTNAQAAPVSASHPF